MDPLKNGTLNLKMPKDTQFIYPFHPNPTGAKDTPLMQSGLTSQSAVFDLRAGEDVLCLKGAPVMKHFTYVPYLYADECT